jgi:uncharacterized protein
VCPNLYTRGMRKPWLLGLLLFWVLSGGGVNLGLAAGDALDAGKLQAKREARDRRFRDPASSPLAVVAIARLDRARTTIGSAADADLRLPSPAVAGIHAEIIREEPEAGSLRWSLRPVSGEVTEAASGKKIESEGMIRGKRYRIGSHAVYFDQLGTFGAVVRAVDPASPALGSFQGLRYFAPDPKYRVEAEVLPFPRLQPVVVADTNGWNRPGWRFGEARFSLDGKQLSLVLLLFTPDPGPEDSFFVAFRDDTSGNETYGAGRYLDVPFSASGPIILDFNEAYNPSCAYNAGFACPLPPRENRLPAAIRAGEKNFKEWE